MRQSAETKSEPKTTLAELEPLSRRSLLVGLAAGAALSIPILSKPAEAAVSMLRTGVDPSVVEPDDFEVGRGGRGRGGRGRGGRGRGRGRSFGGRGRGRRRGFARGRGRGRGRRWHGHRHWHGGRRWYGGRGWYGGGWGWGGGCYNPWYRRTYWWRCRGIWLSF